MMRACSYATRLRRRMKAAQPSTDNPKTDAHAAGSGTAEDDAMVMLVISS
jgi:hypothetical protein